MPTKAQARRHSKLKGRSEHQFRITEKNKKRRAERQLRKSK